MGLRLRLFDDDVDHARDHVVIAEGDVHELHAQRLKLVQRHLHNDDHDAKQKKTKKQEKKRTKRSDTKTKH